MTDDLGFHGPEGIVKCGNDAGRGAAIVIVFVGVV